MHRPPAKRFAFYYGPDRFSNIWSRPSSLRADVRKMNSLPNAERNVLAFNLRLAARAVTDVGRLCSQRHYRDVPHDTHTISRQSSLGCLNAVAECIRWFGQYRARSFRRIIARASCCTLCAHDFPGPQLRAHRFLRKPGETNLKSEVAETRPLRRCGPVIRRIIPSIPLAWGFVCDRDGRSPGIASPACANPLLHTDTRSGSFTLFSGIYLERPAVARGPQSP